MLSNNMSIGDFKVMWVIAAYRMAHGVFYIANITNALSSTRKPFWPWILPGHPLDIAF